MAFTPEQIEDLTEMAQRMKFDPTLFIKAVKENMAKNNSMPTDYKEWDKLHASNASICRIALVNIFLLGFLAIILIFK